MRRRRRHLLALLLTAIALGPARAEEADRRRAPSGVAGANSVGPAAPGAAARSPASDPSRPDPGERQRQLEAWWARQRQKEAADRFWNGPREARRNLTRDQIERWEYQRNRRRGWPNYPF